MNNHNLKKAQQLPDCTDYDREPGSLEQSQMKQAEAKQNIGCSHKIYQSAFNIRSGQELWV